MENAYKIHCMVVPCNLTQNLEIQFKGNAYKIKTSKEPETAQVRVNENIYIVHK